MCRRRGSGRVFLLLKILFSYTKKQPPAMKSNKGHSPTRFWGRALVVLEMLAFQFSTIAVQGSTGGLFVDRTELIPFDTQQLNYGVAVADVDGDGELEWIVAGYNGPNTVLKLDRKSGRYIRLTDDPRFEALKDPQGQAIGVCACDIDGDGREEIYFLNTNDRYSGPKVYKDKLFKWRRGTDGVERFEDLFSDPGNDAALSMFAGRSVAAIDRKGTGRYGVILATYAQDGQGSFGLIELDVARSNLTSGRLVLKNAAQEAGLAMSTGGRGIAIGPISGSGFSDIFFDNEGGFRDNPPENAFFVNDGSGHFVNQARSKGLDDPLPGRGVALADFNNDGRLDIVYGNWNSPHKLMLQQTDGSFQDVAAGSEMAVPSPVRTVIAADFDNDGNTEVFFNNIAYRQPSPNKLFRVAPTPGAPSVVSITRLDVGEAAEPEGRGTGGAVSDLDGDGRLELLLSHGESAAQALSLYHVTAGRGQGWLRVVPFTPFGAPARGARVTLTLSDGTRLTRVVDGGSGYLCQMEPVAHFGLGTGRTAVNLEVTWPDGQSRHLALSQRDLNRQLAIPHPRASTASAPSGPGEAASRYPEPTGFQRANTAGVLRQTLWESSLRMPLSPVPAPSHIPSAVSRSDSSCRATVVRNYVADEAATGCYSARPIRMRRCQGACAGGSGSRSCCQETGQRWRRVRFTCRSGASYSKLTAVGAARCQCTPCPT